MEQIEKETISRLTSDAKSGIQDTVLWTGGITNVGQTATLSDSIENYKYLMLETRWSNSPATTDTLVNVETIRNLGYFPTNYSWQNSHSFICMYDTYYIYIYHLLQIIH